MLYPKAMLLFILGTVVYNADLRGAARSGKLVRVPVEAAAARSATSSAINVRQTGSVVMEDEKIKLNPQMQTGMDLFYKRFRGSAASCSGVSLKPYTYIAELDGRLSGHAFIYLKNTATGEKEPCLTVFVYPADRKLSYNIALALLEKIVEIVDGDQFYARFPRLVSYVYQSNAPTIAAFKAVGFDQLDPLRGKNAFKFEYKIEHRRSAK